MFYTTAYYLEVILTLGSVSALVIGLEIGIIVWICAKFYYYMLSESFSSSKGTSPSLE
jgi:hypothetical protein